MLFAAIDGLQDCGYVLTIRIQVCADERELAVEEVRALAKIVCAIALHFDDGILFVRLFLRGDMEEEPDKKYAVVEVKRDGTHYFCQCSDFFYRKLPFIGTNLYANCKHITAILEAVNGGK